MISCILQSFALPITKEFKFFSIAYIWGTFSIIMNWHSYLPNNIKLFGELFVDTYLISTLIYIMPSRFKSITKTAVLLTIFTTTIIDTLCFVRFDTHISSQLVQLCIETNSREVREFFSTYIDEAVFYSPYSILLFIIIIATFIILYNKSVFICYIYNKHKYLGVIVFILLVIGLFFAKDNKRRAFGMLSANTSSELLKIQSHDIIASRAFYLPVYKLIGALHANKLNSNQVYHQLKINNHVVIDSCTYTSPNIILIIGESYNKHHSQLYGYKLPTTPFQIKEMKEGNLYVYKDAVTNYNLTSQVFKNMLSLNDISQNEDWSETPLVTQIFRKAGYNTYFISNQFVANDSRDDFAGAFINNKELSESQFTYRNNHMHEYDTELVSCFDSLNNQKAKNLIIFHLVGQHVDYHERYPTNFKRIDLSMYTPNSLSKKELNILCDYDNATAFNDYVISLIINRFRKSESIILYLADHGEECYDEIKTFGRSHTTNITPPIAKNEFEIPFWIWLSPSYKLNHPDIAESIQLSKHKPFYNGDLGHLLISLGGIKCKYYRKNNDILNPEYKKHKRIINEIADYDIITSSTKN